MSVYMHMIVASMDRATASICWILIIIVTSGEAWLVLSKFQLPLFKILVLADCTNSSVHQNNNAIGILFSNTPLRESFSAAPKCTSKCVSIWVISFFPSMLAWFRYNIAYQSLLALLAWCFCWCAKQSKQSAQERNCNCFLRKNVMKSRWTKWWPLLNLDTNY